MWHGTETLKSGDRFSTRNSKLSPAIISSSNFGKIPREVNRPHMDERVVIAMKQGNEERISMLSAPDEAGNRHAGSMSLRHFHIAFPLPCRLKRQLSGCLLETLEGASSYRGPGITPNPWPLRRSMDRAAGCGGSHDLCSGDPGLNPADATKHQDLREHPWRRDRLALLSTIFDTFEADVLQTASSSINDNGAVLLPGDRKKGQKQTRVCTAPVSCLSVPRAPVSGLVGSGHGPPSRRKKQKHGRSLVRRSRSENGLR